MVYDSFRKGITMEKCKTKTIQTGLDTFRHNQAYLKNYVNRAAVLYSKPWDIQNQKHIQNPGLFRTPV